MYYGVMVKAHGLPQDNLARNIKFLMARHGHTAADLAVKLKGQVSRSALHYILNCEKIARIDTAEHIARVYGLSAWQIISPTLQHDIEKSPAVATLVDNYSSASPEGRKHIEQVAEREAEYVAKSDG